MLDGVLDRCREKELMLYTEIDLLNSALQYACNLLAWHGKCPFDYRYKKECCGEKCALQPDCWKEFFLKEASKDETL